MRIREKSKVRRKEITEGKVFVEGRKKRGREKKILVKENDK